MAPVVVKVKSELAPMLTPVTALLKVTVKCTVCRLVGFASKRVMDKTVGGAKTERFAVLLAVPGVVVCVVVTPEVAFGFVPTVVLVTANVTVQLPLAGIVIPLKLNAVAFAASVFGVVPAQVPPTAPPTALMLASVSVNDALVNGDALLLLNVRVTVELPPD